MRQKRTAILVILLAVVGVITGGAWLAASRVQSPADAAARTAPPTPSPILVPVEERVLSSKVITRGTARFGLPQVVSIAPSALKPDAALITTLPLRNAQLDEGHVMLTASGRPLFVLQGSTPAYRDLTPGITGDDVRQLEEALVRLGFDPGPLDRTFDRQTSAAVEAWYRESGWDPFGPTVDQLVKTRALQAELGEATKLELVANASFAAAELAVESARATADLGNRVAAGELATRLADQARNAAGDSGAPLAVESERAKARYTAQAAEADLAAAIAERALVVSDPRQTETARAAAEARLELARAVALKTKLESELSIQAAERDAKLASERLEMAQASVEAGQLAGEMAIRAALDKQKVAELEVRLAAARVARVQAEVDLANSRLGVQVPVDEVIFVPALPVRVEEITAVVGDPARGPVMSVTDNQLAVDAFLPLASAPLVRAGMPVSIDEQALGISAKGAVRRVAPTPGTFGADGYHIYFEIGVTETKTPLEGCSVRLTIPIQGTEGAVIAVPVSAVSLASDGRSRVQVANDAGELEYVVVEPGLSAEGFVEVHAVGASLTPGQLVVVGYESR